MGLFELFLSPTCSGNRRGAAACGGLGGLLKGTFPYVSAPLLSGGEVCLWPTGLHI